MQLTNQSDYATLSQTPISDPRDNYKEEHILNLSDFEEELKRLAAANQELMQAFHSDDVTTPQSAAVDDLDEELKRLATAHNQLMDGLDPNDGAQPDAYHESQSPHSQADELSSLRAENTQLKARIKELEELLQSPATPRENAWNDRQREYEMLLEEKSEVIRNLHLKNQEILESSSPDWASPLNVDNAQAEEILRLKQELEEQRLQLQQDEEDVMDQLKVMELTMARERADMARQRQEITRLHEELAREIELASRDPGLRERLQYLRPNHEASKATPGPMQTPVANFTPEAAKAASELPERKSSGFYRRLFG